MLRLAYDTETTGLPDWKKPSQFKTQPHMVQLGAILFNDKDFTVTDQFDVLIKPLEWEIPQDTIDVHGITMEKAMTEGIKEEHAYEYFMMMAREAKGRTLCHNRTFDERIIRIASKRYGTKEEADWWKERDKSLRICTMLQAKPHMKLPPKKQYGYKNPKLSEAYEHYCRRPMDEVYQAHSAIDDIRATLNVYREMTARGHITI